jgi:AcrR family transcriptional regulator
MRADAKKNYAHLLAVARDAVSAHGAEASLRDIARKSDVGLGTLYRHFPTREALLEALLRTDLDKLTQMASQPDRNFTPDQALLSWFHEGISFTRTFGGVVELVAAALANPESALHSSCSMMRSAGADLLKYAQDSGTARKDIDGTDLLALIAAFAWTGDQPAFASRADHLSSIIASALFVR